MPLKLLVAHSSPSVLKAILMAFPEPEFEIHHSEGRAAVAADEPRRFQSRGLIEGPLHQRNAHDRLRTGHQYAPGFAAVTVDEFVVVEH